MNPRILRALIFLFLGLITVFSGLIFLNDVRARIKPAPAEVKRDNVADSYMQGLLTNPRIRQKLPEPGALPSARAGLSPAAAGTMIVVKSTGFSGVAEKPKDMVAELREKNAERLKPPPIVLKPSARVALPRGAPKEKALTDAPVPQPGSGAEPGENGLVRLPVSYKLFGGADLWAPFSQSRGISSPEIDFSVWDMLILVPAGDYPASMLSVAGVENTKSETVVKYRVNPQSSVPSEDEELKGERYAFAPVPKKKKIKLLQVP